MAKTKDNDFKNRTIDEQLAQAQAKHDADVAARNAAMNAAKASQKEIDRLKKAKQREEEKAKKQAAAEEKKATEKAWIDACYVAEVLPANDSENYANFLAEFLAEVKSRSDRMAKESAGEYEGDTPS